MNDSIDTLFTIHQVAAILSVRFGQALGFAIHGTVKAVKVDDEVRVRQSDLARLSKISSHSRRREDTE